MNLLYNGKAKQIFATDNPDNVIVYYKDDASAYNGIKRAQITNKGVLNNKISSIIYKYLEENGIKTHFISRVDDRNQLCLRKEVIIPIEFITRNIAAGTMARRLGLEVGTKFDTPIYEYCYKNEELGDPLINQHHAVALKLSNYDELSKINALMNKINNLLITLFEKIDIILVDFKIEFGYLPDGSLVLSDELSPDTCRLWDINTHESLDRDRFRRDLGRVAEAYEIILNRLTSLSI